METAALQAAVRAHGLTLNTLAQGAWALLLSRASGEKDVVFGVTVSGRPPELPGVEAILGLFINTLPARVRLPDEASVSSWLAGLHLSARHGTTCSVSIDATLLLTCAPCGPMCRWSWRIYCD